MKRFLWLSVAILILSSCAWLNLERDAYDQQLEAYRISLDHQVDKDELTEDEADRLYIQKRAELDAEYQEEREGVRRALRDISNNPLPPHQQILRPCYDGIC